MAGTVCSAMAFVPQGYKADKAAMPQWDSSPLMASLKLQKVEVSHALPARSPISAFTLSNRPLEGIKICVDPGHGGQQLSKTHYTGGTIGVATGQTESDVNLRVALLLREYLKAAGARVVMTRESDVRCQGDTCKRAELDFRSDVANDSNADLFISVHHNEGTNVGTNYTAVFYDKGVTGAVPLAENISSAVSRYIGTQNVGAKPADYRVLSKVKMPGVIVEASFMSNAVEDKRLANLAYNKMEAKAICTGILNYFRVTRGRQVDFRTIFAPIDDQAGSAQAMADASFVRRQIVERKSLFGRSYEELSYDAAGNVVSRREIGNSSVEAKKSVKSTLAKTKTKVSSTASKLASAVSKTSTAAAKETKKVASKVSTSSKTPSKTTSSSSTSKKAVDIPEISKPVVSTSNSSAKKTSIAWASNEKSAPKKSTSASKKSVD